MMRNVKKSEEFWLSLANRYASQASESMQLPPMTYCWDIFTGDE